MVDGRYISPALSFESGVAVTFRTPRDRPIADAARLALQMHQNTERTVELGISGGSAQDDRIVIRTDCLGGR